MKQHHSITIKWMTAILVLGISAYLAVYIAQGWNNELSTTLAYSAVVNVGVNASGMVIREETVIPGSGSFVDLVPSEGERVAAGQTVAILYSQSSGLDTRQAIKTLSVELEQLNYALSSGIDGADTAKLDLSVLQSITNLRTLSVSDDLSALEDAALNLRTMVFKRDYTYGSSSAASGISALIQEKQAQLQQLQSSLSHVSTIISAPRSGIFSGVADGFEGITADSVRAMKPSELSSLIRQEPVPTAGTVGKLVTSSTWYFAAVLDEENARQLMLDRSYTVTFSHDWFGNVDMTLEWISDKENGQVIALFSSRSKLSETTLLRNQNVDIVTQQLEGIRVPRRALRVITQTVTDKDTGETSELRYTAVFTLVGQQAELKKVNVLYEDNNFYLVEPVDAAAVKRLRAGDTIILNSADLFDGKVVQ